MFDVDHWTGAQWLILYWIIGTAICAPAFRWFGVLQERQKEFPEWLGEYLADRINHVVLISVLWWGGFWS